MLKGSLFTQNKNSPTKSFRKYRPKGLCCASQPAHGQLTAHLRATRNRLTTKSQLQTKTLKSPIDHVEVAKDPLHLPISNLSPFGASNCQMKPTPTTIWYVNLNFLSPCLESPNHISMLPWHLPSIMPTQHVSKLPSCQRLSSNPTAMPLTNTCLLSHRRALSGR